MHSLGGGACIQFGGYVQSSVSAPAIVVNARFSFAPPPSPSSSSQNPPSWILTRVGLNVYAPDLGVEVERLECALTAKVLEAVNVLVATVVTSARETFGVLVGEDGTVRLHGCEGGQVLGCDELETGELTPCLVLDDLLYLGVGLCEGCVEHLVLERRRAEMERRVSDDQPNQAGEKQGSLT